MYGTRGKTCWGPADGFDVYTGADLEDWEGPAEVFHTPPGFWADQNYWAPEVHLYKGEFYMFASFKADGICRGTQILKASSPAGPFMPWSDGPVTPRDWECLDGTLYIDKGAPYMVFCHEWSQIKDGAICAVALSDDLKRAAGEPKTYFTASEAAWGVPIKDGDCYVTDGPFMFTTGSGGLLMLWSGFSKDGYAMGTARSTTGGLDGEFVQDEKLLFSKDGGHGMVFRGLDGGLRVTLHTPNDTPMERPMFYHALEKDGHLEILMAAREPYGLYKE